VLLATGELRARTVRFDLIALDLAARTGREGSGVSDPEASGEVVLLEHRRDAW